MKNVTNGKFKNETPKGVLHRCLDEIDTYSQVIVIAVTAEGDCVVKFSDMTLVDLSWLSANLNALLTEAIISVTSEDETQ